MIQSMIVLVVPVTFCALGADARVSAAEPAPPVRVSQASAPSVDSLKAIYQAAQSWRPFYEAINRRRELWVGNWTNAKIPAELATRARTVGSWRILVITEPGCSDSANSVPYIVRLVEMTPGLELRLVNSSVGRGWLEAHRTPDGRAATPTVLVLDEEYRIRGCWIEQPAALQAFWLPIVARGETAGKLDEKMAWYAKDEGRETLRELVEVLEGARNGQPVCPGLN